MFIYLLLLNTKYFGLDWINHKPPVFEEGLSAVTYDDILSEGPIKDEEDLERRKDEFRSGQYYVYRRKICLDNCILQLDMFLHGAPPTLTVFHDDIDVNLSFSKFVERKRDNHVENHYKIRYTNERTRPYIEEMKNDGILDVLLRNVPESKWHIVLEEHKDYWNSSYDHVDKVACENELKQRRDYLTSKSEILDEWANKFSVSTIQVFSTILKGVPESEWSSLLSTLCQEIFW